MVELSSKVIRLILSVANIMVKSKAALNKYGVDQKKVNLVLDQLARCGFLHGVQHVSKNTSIVIFDIAKF